MAGPVFLISASSPGGRHVGEILIADMLRSLRDLEVHVVALTNNPPSEQLPDSPYSVLQVRPPLECDQTSSSGRLASLVYASRRLWSYERSARNKARELHKLLVQAGASRLWVILDSTAVIDVIYFLVREYSFPLYLQVWDDPSHLIFLKKLDFLSARRTLNRFQFLIRSSVKVAVISEQMKAVYEKDSKCTPIIIRHGLSTSTVIPQREQHDPNFFRIGFCGSMYADTAWKAFQHALYLKEWKLGGRHVQVSIASPVIQLDAGTPADVRFYGWQTPEHTARLMAECDLLYLPQGFDAGQRPITELSFPTKLSTYVQTGRAVFVHSPEYGSLTSFCKAHNFGCLCTVLAPKEIAELLESLASDDVQLAQLAHGTQRIANQVLSSANFQMQVRQFLGS
jgi:hypothetical protein